MGYLENLAKKPREAPEYSGIWGADKEDRVNSKSLRAQLGSSKRRSSVTGPSNTHSLTESQVCDASSSLQLQLQLQSHHRATMLPQVSGGPAMSLKRFLHASVRHI